MSEGLEQNANIVQINKQFPEIDWFTIAFIPSEGLMPLALIGANEDNVKAMQKYGLKFPNKKEAENYILWLEKRQVLLEIIAAANKYYPPKSPIEYGSRNLYTFWHNGKFGIHNNDNMPQIYPIEYYMDNIEAAHFAQEKIENHNKSWGFQLCKFVITMQLEEIVVESVEVENE